MTEIPENSEESSEHKKIDSGLGQVEWLDLTVGDASRIKNFYQTVVGWKAAEVDMGSYSDFNMNSADGTQTVADGNLIPVLVKAVQELSTKIKKLETKLNEEK